MNILFCVAGHRGYEVLKAFPEVNRYACSFRETNMSETSYYLIRSFMYNNYTNHFFEWKDISLGLLKALKIYCIVCVGWIYKIP